MREVKIFILRALGNAGPNPMPDGALKAAVKLAFSHLELNDAKVQEQLESMEFDKWIASTTDALLGRLWALTAAGQMKVKQLQ